MRVVNTILIVDDDVEDASLIRDAINETNPDVKCMFAANGEEALSLLLYPTSPHPDCILLDMNMPKMNGESFLKEMKGRPLINKIPVVMLSTNKMPGEIERMKCLGAAAYFQKPNTFKQLCNIMEKVISRKLAETERTEE